MQNNLKALFLLDPEIHFLNHGSFGACPREVFGVYQEWQRCLERQPVQFLGRDFQSLMRQARQALASWLGASEDELVFVPNATHGVNIVARSLFLKPGDEVLASDHEYGACDNTWRYICACRGARYVRQPVRLQVESSEAVLEQIWQGVTPKTRLIFTSHVTSPTALRFPVEALCARARESGILTLVDGAHAPGLIPLNLSSVGADFYTGNCHKWMLAPKGVGFLYARYEVQHLVEPLVVSWGYSATPETSSGSRFIDYLEWTGTFDPAAALSVPAAIEFMQRYHWETVRLECRARLEQTLDSLAELTGFSRLSPAAAGLVSQMGAAQLPHLRDLPGLKSRLYQDFQVEVPLIEWNTRHLVRISVQAYNTHADLEALQLAFSRLLPEYVDKN